MGFPKIHLAAVACLLATVPVMVCAVPQYPPGFTDQQLATGLTSPTSLAIAADGRIFVAEEDGKIRLLKQDVLQPDPVATVRVDSTGEKGLLGIVLDPHFTDNGYLYTFYTVPDSIVHNRLTRLTVAGDKADLGSEIVLMDFPSTDGAQHVGGGMAFGPDGLLYVDLGDCQRPNDTQKLNTSNGKILRLRPDGSIPADNPFQDSGSQVERAVWAYGFREPFTMAMQPSTGRLFVNDVGESNFEEVDEVVRGGNYGWPIHEGYSSDAKYISPIFSYSHREIFNPDQCSAVIGGDFYNPPAPQFPSAYVGEYFFMDLCQGWIRRLNPATGKMHAFASGLPLPTGLKVAPNGNLYYIARGVRPEEPPIPIGKGSVHKVGYPQALPPQILSQPVDVDAKTKEAITLRVNAAGTPPLQYQWYRNGLKLAGADQPSYTLASAAEADDGARFFVSVTNSVGAAMSRQAVLTLADARPVCVLDQPAAGTRFDAGQTIAFAATCKQPSGAALPEGDYAWTVERRAGFNVSPYLTGNTGATGAFDAAFDSDSSAWYRVILTAKSAGGAATVLSRDVFPNNGKVWELFLGDAPWSYVLNGWGPVERNLTNGDSILGDGKTLTLRGRAYAKGLGVHAYSRITYPLNGNCLYFLSDMGVDDAEIDGGSLDFQIWGDTLPLYESGPLTTASSIRGVELPLGGVATLNLVAHNNGGLGEQGVGDWAGARVICQTAALAARTARARAPFGDPLFSARFQPQTGALALGFDLPASGPVKLEIRDQKGRLLGRPVDGVRPSGPLNLDWNPGAQRLRGLVFAILTTNGGTWARKVLAL